MYAPLLPSLAYKKNKKNKEFTFTKENALVRTNYITEEHKKKNRAYKRPFL